MKLYARTRPLGRGAYSFSNVKQKIGKTLWDMGKRHIQKKLKGRKSYTGRGAYSWGKMEKLVNRYRGRGYYMPTGWSDLPDFKWFKSMYDPNQQRMTFGKHKKQFPKQLVGPMGIRMSNAGIGQSRRLKDKVVELRPNTYVNFKKRPHYATSYSIVSPDVKHSYMGKEFPDAYDRPTGYRSTKDSWRGYTGKRLMF